MRQSTLAPSASSSRGRLPRRRRRSSRGRWSSPGRRSCARSPWRAPGSSVGQRGGGKRGERRRLPDPLPLVAALIVDNCSGMFMAGYAGVALRAVSFPSVVKPKMLWPVHGWFCWLCYLRAVFPFVVGRPCVAIPRQVALGHRCATTECSALPVETPQGQFLDEVMVFLTSFMVQTVQTIRRFRGCSSFSWTLTSLIVAQCSIPHGSSIQQTIEIPQLFSWWSMSLLCSSTSLSRRKGFFSWSRRFVGPLRFPVAPQHGDRCPFLQVMLVIRIPIEAQRRFHLVQTVCRTTVNSPSCSTGCSMSLLHRSCSSLSFSWCRGGVPWSRLCCGPWHFPSCSSLTR